METILIAGGTGLIGTALSKLLIEKGYKVILLSRSATPDETLNKNSRMSLAYWNPVEQKVDKSAIEQADYIINLAGAGVADKRWTKKRKKEITDSRVQSGKLIVKALTENPNKVKLVINASGIGWYGEDPIIPNTSPFTEDMPPTVDFWAIPVSYGRKAFNLLLNSENDW
jgi:NAD dependent epimerase/dehydratase family enzyme